MQFRNTQTRYGLVAIILHWTMAILIISLLILGLYMTELPISIRKLKLYGWHKEYGTLVLMLLALRITWRFSNVSPLLPSHLPNWQKLAAHSAHLAFYFFMLAMPVTGWMMSSAAGLTVSFFGLFNFPNLVSPSADLQKYLSEIHEWLGYGLIATLCAHIGATLQHHFIYKDDILRRMLP